MGGKRLSSFREGDRSEYLAQYALSRLAFVTEIPRQEDFGVVDFLCVLGNDHSKSVLAENAFYVQVKSSAKRLEWDSGSVRWVSEHMDLPLIFCIVTKAESRIRLYSTSNVLRALFLRTTPARVIIEFDTPLPLGRPTLKNNEGEELLVPLGPPIVDATVDQIESRSIPAYELLRPWLVIDKLNIARRAVGRIYVSLFTEWETNAPQDPNVFYNEFFMGPNYDVAEKQLAPILTALAHNYRHAEEEAKLNALIPVLKQFYELLDQHGKKFADGELPIKDG